MSIQLSKKEVISREMLRVVADSRLQEADSLFHAKHYASSIYLAGYAVECYLKLAICVTLDWDVLMGTFKTHDLEGLLLYSGLNRRLKTTPTVAESFARIVETWALETGNDPVTRKNIRYSMPTDYDEEAAARFLHDVKDDNAGVIPWLRSKLD